MITKNTEFWDVVCKTDPAHTKSFSRTGGFKGTAIKPYWLIRRATEVFGLCGIGWGWEEIENKYVAGVWCSKVRLWYTLDGRRGEIEQWGQTQMEGTNKHGAFVDEEAPKKAVTDAMTKCLSYLGFAGDVHMGMFDDSKYVEERRKEETAKVRAERVAEIKKALAESADPAVTWQEHLTEINNIEQTDAKSWEELKKAGATRKQQLMGQEKATDQPKDKELGE